MNLYVAPDGNDSWSGRLPRPNRTRTDGPLASLRGARDAVRRLKANGAPQRPIRVQFASGVYPVTEPVLFTPEDSGSANAPIVYEATPGAKPVIEGGRRLGGFREGKDGIWITDIPEVREGKWYFEQLWVNGRRATRARSPNQFYFYMLRRVDEVYDPLQGRLVDMSKRAFIARLRDIQPLEALSPEQLRDVTVVVYHSFEISRLRVAAMHLNTGVVYTTGEAKWSFLYWGPNQRYHLENYLNALDAPGEWFLSRDGKLYYKPLPGEDLRRAEVYAPVTEAFLVLDGKPEEGKQVEHLTFRGLTFRHAQYLLPAEGCGDWQAAFSVPAVIMADGARHVTLQDCEVAHIGTYAVWFRRACTDCRVERCYLHDLGAGGVRIGEGAIPIPIPFETGRVRVHNCILHEGGRIHYGAVGIWIGQSSDNEITHNDISDFFYTGVSVGWTWGYGHSLAQRNRIEYNHIHHLGGGVLSDMGGVYTLGVSPGTTIRHNVIHDIYSYDLYGYGGWGLYNDEGSSHIVLENNLVYRAQTGAYHQHFGRANVVRNNIFAFSADGMLRLTRAEPHLSFTFERNIVLWEKTYLLQVPGAWKEANLSIRRNLYWRTDGEPILFGDLSWREWRLMGRDLGSLIADPLFVAPGEGDFRLRAVSPALLLGFQPFDYTRAGVTGDPQWVALAKGKRDAPAPSVPLPPPLELWEDFESTPVGKLPHLLQANVEGKGDSIRVTEEVTFRGKRSLKVTDATGLQYAFNPELVVPLGNAAAHRRGVTRLRFALRTEPGAVLWHEWRDWRRSPYLRGPSFVIQNNQLQVQVGDHWVAPWWARTQRGEERDTPTPEPIPIPAGQWVVLEVWAELGKPGGGQWGLQCRYADGSERVLQGLPSQEGFEILTWIGFPSNATEDAVFYLDDIELLPESSE